MNWLRNTERGRAAFAAAALATAVASAAIAEESAIVVEADAIEYESDGNVLRARGGVSVSWNDNRLEAEEVVVEQQERDVTATGGVILDAPEVLLTADFLDLSIDDETGVMRGVDVQVKGRPGRFGGAVVEKLPGRRYGLQEGYYTTCETEGEEPPAWELTGQRLDIELDAYGRVHDGTFEVRGTPVLYLPYAVFPTKETRQSGLLVPQIGSSDDRGFVYAQPYFVAIDKHRDLTLTAQVETAARIGLNGEYRYRPSLLRSGRVEASYFNEQIRGDGEKDHDPDAFEDGVIPDIPQNRGFLELRHRERAASGAAVAYADLRLVSDDLYLREIDSLAKNDRGGEYRRALRYTDSRLGVVGHHGFASYGLEMVGYQDFKGADRFTLQRPATAWLNMDGDFAGIGYGVDGELASFGRREGSDGQRLDLATTLSRSLGSTGPLHAGLWLRGRATAYHLEERDELDAEGGLLRRLDEFPLRGLFEGGFDARTKLAREYGGGEGAGTLRHTLEPFLRFHYTSGSSDDELPLFDGTDSVDGRTTATYGVDSGFFTRQSEEDTASEVARVSLGQSYNFSDEVISDHFSDIDLAAFVRPLEGLALRTLTSYNVGSSEITGSHVSMAYEAGPSRLLKGPRSTVAAAYRFARGDVLRSAEGLALLGITETVSIGLKGRYDFESDGFVEKAGGIRLRSACDCWTIDVGVVSRVNPDELQFRILVELTGLGGIGQAITENPSPALEDLNYDDRGFWRPGW